MQPMRKIIRQILGITKDENFMHAIEHIEVLVSKVLSIFMVVVILVAIADLAIFIIKEVFTTPYGSINTTLFKVFGLFLNILIALEILENITAYLKRHVFQVELVIVTSLIAVARKIIILDLEKVKGIDIIGLGVAILALSISYLIIRFSNSNNRH
ncbi:alr0613 [Nostoc sp. PCC 7120 = FACHB-418]|nr:alr0613 [Nostoc sp. PCC 7120 = FACHB-418]